MLINVIFWCADIWDWQCTGYIIIIYPQIFFHLRESEQNIFEIKNHFTVNNLQLD